MSSRGLACMRRGMRPRRSRHTRSGKPHKKRGNGFSRQDETGAQLKVYLTPFSSATQQPKIPDGSPIGSDVCNYHPN